MQLDPVLIGGSEHAFHPGKPVYIVPAARRRHLAVFGGTGSGKSTLLRNMIAGDIAAGHGVTVVDPHGQLVEDILENHIPRRRTNDVIYFNPKDRERAFALNMLDCRRPSQRGLVVSNVIGIFKKLWSDSWGPRMEDILRNSLYALIEQPGPVSIFFTTRTTDGRTRFVKRPYQQCSTSAGHSRPIPSSERSSARRDRASTSETPWTRGK